MRCDLRDFSERYFGSANWSLLTLRVVPIKDVTKEADLKYTVSDWEHVTGMLRKASDLHSVVYY